MFATVARRWMHGAQERDVLEQVLQVEENDNVSQVAFLLDEAADAEERRLWEGIDARDLQQIKEAQLRRIVREWRNGPQALGLHADCFRRMLRQLLSPSLDLPALLLLFGLLQQHGCHFAEFDKTLLNLGGGLVDYCLTESSDSVALQQLLQSLGHVLGPSAVAVVFEGAANSCSFHDCPATTVALRCMWRATRALWLPGGVWSTRISVLARTALCSANPLLSRLLLCSSAVPLAAFAALLPPMSAVCSPAVLCHLLQHLPPHLLWPAPLLSAHLAFLVQQPSCPPTLPAALVAAGADAAVVLRCGVVLPSALAEVLSLSPLALALEALAPERLYTLLQPLILLKSPRQTYVLASLFRRYGVRPSLALLAPLPPAVLLPLVTEQVAPLPPFIHLFRSAAPHSIVWRPHTHVFCTPETKQRVVVALLCFSRVAPKLPREIRTYMLSLATASADYEAISLTY